MTFTEYIRKVRRGIEMSQQKLADELNVSYTTVNRWENKHTVPSKLARKSFIDFCVARGIAIPPEILEDDERNPTAERNCANGDFNGLRRLLQ
jgi:transcriptional regulator with XRE-family HTH domain